MRGGDHLRIDIDGCRAAHARLLATLDGLMPGDGRRPSRLPGWTVGHVLTHLARNADSHVRMLSAAQGGAVADQYAGGPSQRAADIEAGAGRSEGDLVADAGPSTMPRCRWPPVVAPSPARRTGPRGRP